MGDCRIRFQEFAEVFFRPYDGRTLICDFIVSEVIGGVSNCASVARAHNFRPGTENVLLVKANLAERGDGVIDLTAEDFTDDLARIASNKNIEMSRLLDSGVSTGNSQCTVVAEFLDTFVTLLGIVVVVHIDVDEPVSVCIAAATTFDTVVSVNLRVGGFPEVSGVETRFLSIENVDEPLCPCPGVSEQLGDSFTFTGGVACKVGRVSIKRFFTTLRCPYDPLVCMFQNLDNVAEAVVSEDLLDRFVWDPRSIIVGFLVSSEIQLTVIR